MRAKLLESAGGLRKFVVALEAGEEAVATLKTFAEAEGLSGSSLSAIGAFERASLGWFNPATKEFRQNEVTDQAEVLSLLGNVARSLEGEVKLHIHAVLGCGDASTRGGHLVAGWVRPTLEVMVEESPTHLQRAPDPRSGLVLLQP